MFRFADLGRVWWPVELPFGGGEDGDQPVTIHLLFQLFTDAELDAREKSALESTARKLLEKRESIQSVDELLTVFDAATAVKAEDRASVAVRTLDWRDVADGSDTPVAFTTDRLMALLAHRPVFTRVRDALFQASREGERKN